MKKIFLSLCLCLMAVCMNAQSLTWDNFVNTVNSTLSGSAPVFKEVYQSMGLDCDVDVYFNKAANEFVIETKFDDGRILDYIDAASLEPIKQSFVESYIQELTPTGSLDDTISLLEKNNGKFVFLYTGDKNGQKVSKQVDITADDFKKAKK